jgi:PPP family 3-phenylpropionic acid transporter
VSESANGKNCRYVTCGLIRTAVFSTHNAGHAQRAGDHMSSVTSVRLSALYFAYFAYVGAFSPYFALYLQSLGQSALEIGVLLSLMQCMRIFAPNAWAGMADRSGRNALLLKIALLASFVGWFGVFATEGFWGLFAVLSLCAFFISAAMPLVESVTFAHLQGDIGRYGQVRVWGSVGFIVAVLGVGAVLDRSGIGAVPVCVSLALAASFAISLMIPDASGAPPRADTASVWRVLKSPHALRLFAACFLMCLAHGPLYAFFSIYLSDQGYSKALVGVLWSLGVLAEIAVFAMMPQMFRRFSAQRILAFSFACAVVRFLLIGWLIESLPLLIIAQIMHAATFGSYHASALALVNRLFGEGQRSRGQALYISLSYGAGGMAGSVASGFAWESIGPAWTFSLASAAALAGLLLLRKALE